MITLRTTVENLKQDKGGVSLILGKISGLNAAERSELSSLVADGSQVEVEIKAKVVEKK